MRFSALALLIVLALSLLGALELVVVRALGRTLARSAHGPAGADQFTPASGAARGRHRRHTGVGVVLMTLRFACSD
jgi:hypothetical protein